MKIASKFITYLLIGSVSLLVIEANAQDSKHALIVDVGNWDKPIVLNHKNIKKVNEIDPSINKYIQDHYEGYRILGRIFTMTDNRFILILTVTNDEDDNKNIYFDMTDVYKNLKKSRDNKQTIDNIESKHKPK